MKKTILPLLVAVGLVGSASAQLVTNNFNYTGYYQSFLVPNGVTSILFELVGASGGDSGSGGAYNCYGGTGATVSGQLTVFSGEIIWIGVGGAGLNPSQMNYNNGNYQGGGWNGGGGGYQRFYSGGGGGATDIFASSTGWSNLLAIAGGGGGATGQGAGGGGGLGVLESGTIYDNYYGVRQHNQFNGDNGQYGGGGGGYWGGFAEQGGSSWVDSSVNSSSIIEGSAGNAASKVDGTATISFTLVPEPSTYALFGLGALALIVAYRRRVA